MSEPATPQQSTDMIGALFGFKGRIGRRRFAIGLLCAFATLVLAMMLAASAMNPTGGGAPLLAIPLLALFSWMLLALSVQRLRDAGRPPVFVVLQLLLLSFVIYPGLEVIDTLWPLLIVGAAIALTLPAFFPSAAQPMVRLHD